MAAKLIPRAVNNSVPTLHNAKTLVILRHTSGHLPNILLRVQALRTLPCQEKNENARNDSHANKLLVVTADSMD